MVGHCHGIELGHGIVAAQYARRVFPCDGTACLNLRPREFGALAAQFATLGHKIVHAAAAVLVARIPVLHRRVFHLGAVLHHNLDDGRVQLILVAHRCRASLKIRYVRIVVGNNQRAFELSRIPCIDAEIRTEFHRATHSLGYIYERAVAEDGAVQCGIEVVAIGHHRAEILAHKVGMLLYGVTY